MAATYANKFTVELSDTARIVFVDERLPKAEGFPASSITAAEIVMTVENARQLGEMLVELVKKHTSV